MLSKQVTLNYNNPEQLFQQRNSAQTYTYRKHRVITPKNWDITGPNNTFLLLHPSPIHLGENTVSTKRLSNVFHFELNSAIFLLLLCLHCAATGHAVPTYSPEVNARGYKTGRNLAGDSNASHWRWNRWNNVDTVNAWANCICECETFDHSLQMFLYSSHSVSPCLHFYSIFLLLLL